MRIIDPDHIERECDEMEPTKMEPMMEMWLEKANVLIEALPYIQRCHGKTVVVKYG